MFMLWPEAYTSVRRGSSFCSPPDQSPAVFVRFEDFAPRALSIAVRTLCVKAKV